MRALTLHQPWTSLIAVGVKTIETRSWSTKYRGPLLIHAAKRTPDHLAALGPIFTALEAAGVDPRAVLDWTTSEHWVERGIDSPRTWEKPMPLGAVVATCTLADVVPMIGCGDYPPRQGPWLSTDPSLLLRESPFGYDVSDQRPYGLFEPDRFAWLLADVRPLTSPVPAKGRQGLWTPDADLIAAVEAQR